MRRGCEPHETVRAREVGPSNGSVDICFTRAGSKGYCRPFFHSKHLAARATKGVRHLPTANALGRAFRTTEPDT